MKVDVTLTPAERAVLFVLVEEALEDEGNSHFPRRILLRLQEKLDFT